MINRTWWFLLSILFLNLIAYYFIIYNNHKNTQKLLHKIQKLKNNIENYIKNIKSQNFKLETTNQQLYSCNSTLLHLSTTLETLENEKKVLDAQISNQDSLLQFYSLRFGRIETPNEFTMRYKKVTLKYHNLKNFKKRKEKVLIIDGFPFNKEFDILKLRLNMYKNEVDYHIIVESKFTQTWKPKRLYFNERKEEFKEFEHKIIHIIIDHHPEKLQGVQEDWNNEVYVREIIGKEGLLKIPHLKDEDMVFITDVDELIDPDIYWFTKNYEGYSFPISISIRWSFYGFYYRVNRPTIISVGASAEYIKNQLNYNTHKLRATQGAFTFGEGNNYAGWHCSWCFPVTDFKHKLHSIVELHTQNKNPLFEDLNVLKYMKKNGIWVSLVDQGIYEGPEVRFQSPEYAKNHIESYGYLIDPKYENLNYVCNFTIPRFPCK